jgi:hypothetical protein
LVLKDQMGGEQSAARLQQTTQQRSGQAEWRVGHDVVGPSGETEVAGIGLDDHDGVPETLARVPGSIGMCFHRDHPSATGDEGAGERSHAGADVDDEGAWGYRRLSNEPARPWGVELVPRPAPL